VLGSRFSSQAAAADVKSNKIAENAMARLSSLFTSFGAEDYIGEPISIAEHSIQVTSRTAGTNSFFSRPIQP
jgi:hypothetical protein